jgi:hypothetical protein
VALYAQAAVVIAGVRAANLRLSTAFHGPGKYLGGDKTGIISVIGTVHSGTQAEPWQTGFASKLTRAGINVVMRSRMESPGCKRVFISALPFFLPITHASLAERKKPLRAEFESACHSDAIVNAMQIMMVP